MRRGRNRRGLATVSGFVTTPEEAETAIEVLLAGGVPRDLVEVLVSSRANEEHYGGKAYRLGTLALPYAAAGALIGLFAGIVVSIDLLLIPGFELPDRIARVQLLGPNMGTMVGAVIGAIVGALRRREPHGVYARVGERDAILLVVFDRPLLQAPAVARLLEELGVQDVRIDQEAPAALPEAAQRLPEAPPVVDVPASGAPPSVAPEPQT